MQFTWQESKRRTNLKKHGFDFAQAEAVFDGPTLSVEDASNYAGEQRFNSTGLLGVQTVVICHTETPEQIHIISMRKAETHETRRYFSYL